jgi:YHS domain-containing protein
MEIPMRSMKTKLLSLLVAATMLPAVAAAADAKYGTVAAQGYDVVGYFADAKAEKGDGTHVATHDGQTYLFANDAHKKAFEASPEKYLPQYGSWCAYGVALNKKFVGDPTVWKIVDGKLYFNLNKDISATWSKDIKGYVTKADAAWGKIADKDASAL